MSKSSLLFYSSTLVMFILLSHHHAKSEDADNNYGDGSITPSPTACNNCTICQYPCHPQPPPPPSSGDIAPPPPPSGGQVNCPPVAPVICCGGGGQYYAPPTPFYYPYNNYSGVAKTLRLSALIMPTSYVSMWPLTISFCCVLLFICY